MHIGRETQLLAMIRHPYIVKYEDCFIEDGFLFVVMENAGGGTMEKFCDPGTPVITGNARCGVSAWTRNQCSGDSRMEWEWDFRTHDSSAYRNKGKGGDRRGDS